jgi:hypothetical protein
MKTIYFNDDNQAYIVFSAFTGRTYVMFDGELSALLTSINKLPIDVDLKYDEYMHVHVQFKNAADNEYFKILTADGIEL